MGNLVTDILSKEKEKCKSFVINTEILETINSTIIARLFEDTIYMITSDVIEWNDTMLTITDTVPYMIKAIKAIDVLYPRIIYLTCLDHLLKRSLFPNVDILISNGKKLFTKSRLRHVILSKMHQISLYHQDLQ